MTPAAFDAFAGPSARQCAAAFGLDPDLCLTQFAVETGWGGAWAGAPNNLANIETAPGVFAQYPSLDAFTQAYIWVLRNGSAVTGIVGGDYAGVRASASQSVDVQMRALGASPWDAGHYDNGGGPGSQLITYWEELRLATLDDIFHGIEQVQNLLENGTDAFPGYAGTVHIPTPADLLAAIKAIPPANVTVDNTAVLAAIADLKAHPSFDPNDATILSIVQRLEAALKTA